MIKEIDIMTADELIIEYMIEKAKNGYSPSFTISEFMDFLTFFEREIKVEDVLDDGRVLVERFLKRECAEKWYQKDDITNDKLPTSHFDFIEESELVKINYRFRDSDTHLLTYHTKTIKKKAQEIIKRYLEKMPKRSIAIAESLSEEDLLVGNLISANIIQYVWKDYVDGMINIQKWPSQCHDIYKNLLDMDLASMIELPSIKKQTIEFYNIISRRIATLYQKDKSLRIINYSYKGLLSYSNFLSVMREYENYASSFCTLNEYNGRRSLEISVGDNSFLETHRVDYSCWYENKITKVSIDNENAKKLVYKLNEIQKQM